MGNTKLTKGVLATAGLAAALFGVVVVGADARGGSGGGTDTKQNVMSAMTCGGTSTLQAGYNKSGSRVLIGIAGSGLSGDDSWSGTVTDGDMVRPEGPASGTDWGILDGYEATKGNHAVLVQMTSSAGESCTATLNFKV